MGRVKDGRVQEYVTGSQRRSYGSVLLMDVAASANPEPTGCPVG